MLRNLYITKKFSINWVLFLQRPLEALIWTNQKSYLLDEILVVCHNLLDMQIVESNYIIYRFILLLFILSYFFL